MSPTTIIALIVRFFSIGLFIFLIRVVVPEIFGLLTFEDYTANVFLAFVVAIVFFIAVFLWKFPLFVASKLADFSSEDSTKLSLSESSAYRLGVVMLGLYLFYWAVSDSFYWAYMLFSQREILGLPLELGTQEKAMIFSTVVQLMMSVYLIFGSKRISDFLRKVRKAGLEQ
jgi:hypothetical protein